MSSPADLNPFASTASLFLAAPANNPFAPTDDTSNTATAPTPPTIDEPVTDGLVSSTLSLIRVSNGRVRVRPKNPPPQSTTPPPAPSRPLLQYMIQAQETMRPPLHDVSFILNAPHNFDAATLSVAKLYRAVTTSGASSVAYTPLESMIADVKQASSERKDTCVILLCACGVVAHLGSNNAATSLNEREVMAVVAQAMTEHLDVLAVMIQAVAAAAVIQPMFVADHMRALLDVLALYEHSEFIQESGLFTAARAMDLCKSDAVKPLLRLALQRQSRFPTNRSMAESLCAIVYQLSDVKLDDPAEVVTDKLDVPLRNSVTRALPLNSCLVSYRPTEKQEDGVVTPIVPSDETTPHDKFVPADHVIEWSCPAKCGQSYDLTKTKRFLADHIVRCTEAKRDEYDFVLTHEHPLFYEAKPYAQAASYTCNACGGSFTTSSYQCFLCSYDLCPTCFDYHHAGRDQFVWEIVSPLGDWQVLDELSCRQIHAMHIAQKMTQFTLGLTRKRLRLDFANSIAVDLQTGRSMPLRQRQADNETRQKQRKFVHVYNARLQRTADETLQRLFTVNDLKQMIQALRLFGAESPTIRHGLQVLVADLSYKRADVTLITNADTVAAIVKAMEIDDDRKSASNDGVVFLHNMCFSVSNISLALTNTAQATVTSVLSSSRSFFMKAAMRKYYREDGTLIHDAALLSDYESAKSDVQLIVAWLNAHIDDASVASYCCRIMPRLFSNADYNDELIVSAGCADAVLLAMKHHSAVDELQYSASLVLLRLAAVSTSQRLIAAGGLKILARCCHHENISEETQFVLERVFASVISRPLKGTPHAAEDNSRKVDAATLSTQLSTEKRFWDLFGDAHFVVRSVFPLLSDVSFIRANQANRATYHFWYHLYPIQQPLRLRELTRSSGLVRAFECHLSGSRLQCCVDAKAIALYRQDDALLPSPHVEQLRITDIVDTEWTVCLPHVRTLHWETSDFDSALIPANVTALNFAANTQLSFPLPLSLQTIKFDVSHTKTVMSVDQLPPSLTSYTGYLAALDSAMLPATLTSLDLAINGSVCVTLPPSLITLCLNMKTATSKFEALKDLPPTLTQLTVLSVSNVLSDCNSLPPSLTDVSVCHVDYATIKLITQLNALCRLSIQHFHPRNEEPAPPPLTLPQSLSAFDCNDELSRLQLRLSDRLDRLHMRDTFQPFHTELPSNLTEIVFPQSFNANIPAKALPSTLRFMQLGRAFNQQIDCGVLPVGLSCLEFGDDQTPPEFVYEHGFLAGVLPSSLRTLLFVVGYNQAVMILPTTLRTLTFTRAFNQSLGATGIRLPNALTQLTLGQSYNKQIDAAALPPLLKFFDAGESNRHPLPPLPRSIIQLVAPTFTPETLTAPLATFEPRSPLQALTPETPLFTLGNKSRASDHSSGHSQSHNSAYAQSASKLRKKIFRSPKR